MWSSLAVVALLIDAVFPAEFDENGFIESLKIGETDRFTIAWTLFTDADHLRMEVNTKIRLRVFAFRGGAGGPLLVHSGNQANQLCSTEGPCSA